MVAEVVVAVFSRQFTVNALINITCALVVCLSVLVRIVVAMVVVFFCGECVLGTQCNQLLGTCIC